MSRLLPRGFMGFALWVVLGLGVALIPLACGSTSGSDADAPSDMTKPG